MTTMTISQTAREASERILKNAHDPLCNRQAAEVVQAAIDAETKELRKQWLDETNRTLTHCMEFALFKLKRK